MRNRVIDKCFEEGYLIHKIMAALDIGQAYSETNIQEEVDDLKLLSYP